MRLTRILPLLVLLALFGGGLVRAQSTGAETDPVRYIISPENPGPNEIVEIEVQGVGDFLGNSTISWLQNGKTAQSEIGKTIFTFRTGGVGTRTLIHLDINSSTRGTIAHDFVFAPSVMNLVWEADTSAPPLYPGKTLYSAGSQVTVVAFPVVVSGGALVSASKLSYQWTLNDELQTADSGLGKNTFTFDGNQLKTAESISVDAYLGGTVVAHGDLTIPATTPYIIFYDQDPLRGELLDHAIVDTYNLTDKEITFRAEPYFFSNASLARGAVTYDWTLNGDETTGPESSQGILTLRQTGQATGAANVAVSIQNTDIAKIIQGATAALQITFGQSGSSLTHLFGL